jgi:tetratricopeptide (TPR) repeat protein
MLADQGILEDGDEGHEVRPAGGVEIPVPPTVQALIAARIDTLSPQRKALLLDAAIVGRTFWSGAVASISGLDEATVVDELHEIVSSELIRPHRMSQVKDQQEYSFWHLLVRDVAHGLVPRARRAEKHRAAARWLEGIAGDRVEDHAEELAHHSMSALSISRTLGEMGMPGGGARELEADAVRFLLLSGDRASRLDVGRAESFYRRALELIPPGDPQRGVVLAKAAESAASAGRFAESERDYDEAFDELRGAGDARALGRAMAIRARTLYRVVDTVRGLQMSDEAVRMLKDLPPNVDLVMALTRNAGMLLLAGENATCLEVSREAVELAERLGAADEVVRARQFLGAARCELGDAGGMADLREAVRLGLERGLAEETGVAYSNLANQSWLHESPVVGRDTWTQAMEFCEVRGFTAMAMWARTGLLESLLDLGEWDEALAVSERLLSWDRERGGTQHGVFAMAYRAEVFVRRGAVEAATELMDEFLPRAREVSSPLFLAPAAVIAARIELERGDPAAAAACVDEYAAATEDQAGLRADHLPEATRILIAAGRGAAGRLAPSGDRVVATRRRHCLVTAAAALSEAAGDLDAAAAGYADAARRWDAYGHQLERALALGGLGRVLPPLGRTKEANAATTDSRALLESLGVPNDQVPGSVVRLPSEAAASGLKE